jgi:hypothetical protein
MYGKGMFAGPSLRALMTTSGKTPFLFKHFCDKLGRSVPFGKSRKEGFKKKTKKKTPLCKILLKYEGCPSYTLPGTVSQMSSPSFLSYLVLFPF